MADFEALTILEGILRLFQDSDFPFGSVSSQWENSTSSAPTHLEIEKARGDESATSRKFSS